MFNFFLIIILITEGKLFFTVYPKSFFEDNNSRVKKLNYLKTLNIFYLINLLKLGLKYLGPFMTFPNSLKIGLPSSPNLLIFEF